MSNKTQKTQCVKGVLAHPEMLCGKNVVQEYKWAAPLKDHVTKGKDYQ